MDQKSEAFLLTPEECKSAREMVRILCQRFPQAFAMWPPDIKPLMIDIREAILAEAPDLGAERVHNALKWQTSRTGYLQMVTAGAARIDLSGAAVGTVTEKEAADAGVKLAARLVEQDKKAKKAAVKAAAERAIRNAAKAEEAAAWRAARKATKIKLVPKADAPPATSKPLGLADLKAAGQKRRQMADAGAR